MKNYILGLLGLVGFLSADLSASEIVIKSAQKSVYHTKSQNVFRDIVLEAKEVETYSEWILDEEEVFYLECDYVPGNGKGDWKGYYNLPSDRKAQALSQAIKGIGMSRAEEIMYWDIDAFIPKPRSWNDFSREVIRIEEELELWGMSTDVLYTFGKENARNLGYQDEVGDCEWVSGTREIWREVERTVDRRTFRAVVDLEINDGRLLSGEQEEIKLEYDGTDVRVRLDQAINTYAVLERSRHVFELEGRGRKAIAPYVSDFSFNLVESAGSLEFVIKDSRAEELESLNPEYALTVSFSVKETPEGWCKEGSVVATKTVTFDGGEGRVNLSDLLAGGIKPNTKYKVEDIRFERVNASPYFAGQSASTTTKEIRTAE